MKWVRKKIAKFGIDPGNLTLFVESVGGCIRAHHDDCPYSARLVPGGPHRIECPAQPARTAAQIFESAPNLLRAKPWALPLRGKPASRVRMHATEVRFVFDTVAARYGKELAAANEANRERRLELLGGGFEQRLRRRADEFHQLRSGRRVMVPGRLGWI